MQCGEVWYEVAGELTQEGLRPVTPDQECITNILQTHEEKAEEVLRMQVLSTIRVARYFFIQHFVHTSRCPRLFLGDFLN